MAEDVNKRKRVRVQKTDYEMCDMCHQAKSASEIEKVVVVYRRCKQCADKKISLQAQGGSNDFDIPQIPPMRGSTKLRPKSVPVPPPAWREAFNLPAELKKEVAPAMPMIPSVQVNPQTNGQGTTAGDNAQSAEGNKQGENS